MSNRINSVQTQTVVSCLFMHPLLVYGSLMIILSHMHNYSVVLCTLSTCLVDQCSCVTHSSSVDRSICRDTITKNYQVKDAFLLDRLIDADVSPVLYSSLSRFICRDIEQPEVTKDYEIKDASLLDWLSHAMPTASVVSSGAGSR
jgi:hypothetical protein